MKAYYKLMEAVLMADFDKYLEYIVLAAVVFLAAFGGNYASSHYFPNTEHQTADSSQLNVADMNGDGHPDIVFENDKGDVVIGINNGTLNDTGFKNVPDMNFYEWDKSRFNF